LIVSSSDAPTGEYRRNQVLAGVALGYGLERRRAERSPSLAPEVAPGQVTFHARLTGQKVAVVGDWNGWDPEAAPLAPVGQGEFAATLAVPPGRHEYALSVDGVVRPPPDAPSYVDDGFGGRNGVVVVP
jgi:hypothetical protein